ncbi:MAG: acyltransferase [Acidobacteria bacterium]|nr:acyltransferase [Acidobacteriota bacterium]
MSGSADARPPGGRRSPAPVDPRITDIQKEFGAGRSRRQRYADLVVGEDGLWPLVRYELVLLLSSWVPGALGLFLRSKLYPLILGRVGRNVAFGAHIVLRHPRKIWIGDNVVIDDQCCLDAKGTTNTGIEIRDGAFVGRNTILSCKNGDILLDEEANVGFNVEVFSAARVRVGKRVLIAAYTYLVGGDHLYDRVDVPVLHQGRTARGIEVDDNVWLGAHVVVTDGSRVGRDAIVGAGSVVIGDIPDFHIAAGSPARVIRDRRTAGAAEQLSTSPLDT